MRDPILERFQRSETAGGRPRDLNQLSLMERICIHIENIKCVADRGLSILPSFLPARVISRISAPLAYRIFVVPSVRHVLDRGVYIQVVVVYSIVPDVCICISSIYMHLLGKYLVVK